MIRMRGVQINAAETAKLERLDWTRTNINKIPSDTIYTCDDFLASVRIVDLLAVAEFDHQS